MQKWQAYVKGDPKRQEVLEVALKWVSASQHSTIDAYLAQHRGDAEITGLRAYFSSVIDWASGVFIRSPDPQMRGLEWGRLYEDYHSNSYNPAEIDEAVDELRGDPFVKNARGIYEFLLGGRTATKLLDIRLFEDSTKTAAYERQTKAAKSAGISNCSVCASVDNDNNARIYKLTEMEADHVTPWSKGGVTDLANCEMLCILHNRAKGNK
jgi:5-methylcytosine-specific restriction endonuclease McrA